MHRLGAFSPQPPIGKRARWAVSHRFLDECKTSRKGVRGMNLSRRGFFKATGAALATTMAFELSSQTQAFASESKQDWKLVNTEEYTNICCYCAGGCGSLPDHIRPNGPGWLGR